MSTKESNDPADQPADPMEPPRGRRPGRRQVTVAAIFGAHDGARVMLSDGSELVGVDKVEYSLEGNGPPRAGLVVTVSTPPPPKDGRADAEGAVE